MFPLTVCVLTNIIVDPRLHSTDNSVKEEQSESTSKSNQIFPDTELNQAWQRAASGTNESIHITWTENHHSQYVANEEFAFKYSSF